MTPRQQNIENLLLSCHDFKICHVINQSHLHHGHSGSPQTGDSHFLIQIELNDSCSMTTLQVHRKINQLLDTEFKSGLHALSIEILSAKNSHN